MEARMDARASVIPALAAALVAVLTLGPLGAVAWRAGGEFALGPGDLQALRFTLVQALLSAALSAVLAVPVARALARRSFPCRRALVTLLGAPFLLPVIVAVMGLVTIFGQNGLLNAGLQALGLPAVRIYGLPGVVLAHVFLNLPLVVRLLLHGWLAIPAERFRLAASLGFGPGDIARVLERPMLRAVLPGAFLVVFLICLTSFAVALTLGGGPRATTVELAIYHAFRFDFDLGRAALLALVQMALTAVTALVVLRAEMPVGFGGGLDRPVERWDAQGGLAALDAVVLGAAALFLLLPLAAVVLRGLAGMPELPLSVAGAALRSLAVALGATALCLVVALPLALARWRGAALVGVLPLAVSPLVLGTGAFLLIFPLADPTRWALAVTAAANALASLPFVLRALAPAAREVEARYGQLAASLGLVGWWGLWRVTLPRLRRPLGFAAGLAAALSMGDLGVIALFADPDRATLPLELYRLMGAYRMEAAGAAALLLLGLALGLFWLFDRGGRVDADA